MWGAGLDDGADPVLLYQKPLFGDGNRGTKGLRFHGAGLSTTLGSGTSLCETADF